MMEWRSVRSSNISEIGYDPETREMGIKFNSGGTYIYSDVPPEAHTDLHNAASIGRHFHENIRNKYSTRRA
jgi:KTSC domain